MRTTRKWLVAVPTAALLVGGLAAGAQAVSTPEPRPPAGSSAAVGDRDCDRVRDQVGQTEPWAGCGSDCPSGYPASLGGGSGRDDDRPGHRWDTDHRGMDRDGWQHSMSR